LQIPAVVAGIEGDGPGVTLLFNQITARIIVPALFVLLTALAAAPAHARYASLVVDAQTGEVLHAVNADTRNYPASLTKLMTVLMLFEAVDKGEVRLNSPIRMTARAVRQSPTRLGLPEGDSLTVEQAIYVLVIKSANDVAAAVAERLAGSEREFAVKMTARARQLGMTDTIFRNASGLPHQAQMTTATDMAKLARHLIVEQAKNYHYFAAKSFNFRGQTLTTHNGVLREFEGADGLKTGYIRASGFNLVTSAERDGRRLIGVVFGGRTANARDHHMVELLTAGFEKPGRSPTAIARAKPPAAPSEGKKTQPTAVAAKPAPARASNAVAQAGDGLFPPAAGGTSVSASSDDSSVAVGDADPIPDVSVAAIRPAGDWGVQVGAYRSKQPAQDIAERAQDVVPKVLKSGTVEIVPLEKANRSRLYRARITGISKEAAYAACAALREARMHCMELRQTD
jgi:D-alanyl-D-alanine carboxypeptidase